MGRIPSLRRQYLDLNMALIEAEIQRDELAKGAKALRERAEKAEAERDEARAQAVWVEQPYTGGGWPMQHLEVLAPRGKILKASGSWGWRGDGEADARFGVDAEAEALAAGRALPWWEVEA